jgi:hypothetical protein
MEESKYGAPEKESARHYEQHSRSSAAFRNKPVNETGGNQSANYREE